MKVRDKVNGNIVDIRMRYETSYVKDCPLETMAGGAETAKKWRKEIEEYERIYG